MRNTQKLKRLIFYVHETAGSLKPDVHLWLPCGPETHAAVCAPNDLVDMYVSRNCLHLNTKNKRLYTLMKAKKALKRAIKSAHHRIKSCVELSKEAYSQQIAGMSMQIIYLL